VISQVKEEKRGVLRQGSVTITLESPPVQDICIHEAKRSQQPEPCHCHVHSRPSAEAATRDFASAPGEHCPCWTPVHGGSCG
jgi:Cu/Zn superoxide dismutase